MSKKEAETAVDIATQKVEEAADYSKKIDADFDFFGASEEALETHAAAKIEASQEVLKAEKKRQNALSVLHSFTKNPFTSW